MQSPSHTLQHSHGQVVIFIISCHLRDQHPHPYPNGAHQGPGDQVAEEHQHAGSCLEQLQAHTESDDKLVDRYCWGEMLLLIINNTPEARVGSVGRN